MSNTIYLVAYVTKGKEVKSATLYSDVSYSGTLGPKAFQHYKDLVEKKTGDEVEYLLNIQALGVFSEPEKVEYPY